MLLGHSVIECTDSRAAAARLSASFSARRAAFRDTVRFCREPKAHCYFRRSTRPPQAVCCYCNSCHFARAFWSLHKQHTMASSSTSQDNDYLQELVKAAEAQMRRPAPPIQQTAKKQKKTSNTATAGAAADNADAAETVERVSRYSYAAAEDIMKGCTGFLGMCEFKRSNSATKEITDILKHVLPGDTKLQLVKVGCEGLVVVLIDAGQYHQHQQGDKQDDPDGQSTTCQQQQQQQQSNSLIQPTAVVDDILNRIASGSMQRARFCQRLAPIETTCLMEATPLKAAIAKVVSKYIAQHFGCSSCSSQQQSPIEFAVMLKNRNSNAICAKAPKAAAPQEQLQHIADSERLDKSTAITIAVDVMQDRCKEAGGAKVNLSQPQVVLMLEVLPLTGHRQACAVSAIPGSLMVTRPKLGIKPIAVAAAAGSGGK